MNRSTTIIHDSILWILSSIALLGILSEPADDSSTWLSDLFLGKSIGFIAALATYRLYRKWNQSQ